MSTLPAFRPSRYTTEATIEPIVPAFIVPDESWDSRFPWAWPVAAGMLGVRAEREVRDGASGPGGPMAHAQRGPLTDVWDDRPHTFRTLCTVAGTGGLILVIGHAAVSLA